MHSLTKMTQEKFDSKQCDNVLLEWMCTAELIQAENSRMVMACPIMIGDITKNEDGYTGKAGSLMRSNTFANLSNEVPTRTIEKAKELLALQNTLQVL